MFSLHIRLLLHIMNRVKDLLGLRTTKTLLIDDATKGEKIWFRF